MQLDGIVYQLTLRDIKQLGPGKSLQSVVINFIMQLFQQRDNRICQAHKDVNENDNNYEMLKKSKFCTVDFIPSIINNIENAKVILPLNILSQLHRIYIPIEPVTSLPQIDHWTAIIVDIGGNTLKYIDSKYNANDPVSSVAFRNRMLTSAAQVNSYLSLAALPATPWPCEMIVSTEYEPFSLNETDFDSGIYLTTMIDLITHDAPLIFTQTDINLFRINLCYNILNANIS